ncbi:speckle-type POZ protein B-like isoform X12 [Planococcus citri]|uniref:speckle-type POZ protein B-like isoform X12 n=1 Tax=Planococcus citri TaxID=170843 RepID=UPI0031F732C7
MSSSFCGSDYLSNGYKTEIHSDEAMCVWTVTDFDFHEAKGEKLFSPPFPSVKNDQIKWYLELYPNGTNDAKDSVGLYIRLSKLSSFENSKKIFAKPTFIIFNSENKEEAKRSFSTVEEFSHPDIDISGWGFGEFIKKDKKFRNKLLLNNTLRIRCEVKFSDMDNITTGPHQYDFGIEMPECDLSENFASFFENRTFTDVVLSVNGKEYPAHKTVLAARSPVFCAMFKHSTKESELNRVEIVDINEAVVEEMLKYVYTGKCEVSDELVEGLLAAADKYDLGRLKIMCAKKLIEGLSVENATNVLILADMHHHEDLNRKTIKFIVANFAQVLNTVGWRNIILSNPQLVTEVCQAVALNP